MTRSKLGNQNAEILSGIADANRIRIIECLRTGSKNVTELAKLINVEIVTVSHHLGVLRQAGLVQDKKHGRFVVYSLHPKVFNNDDPKATVVDLGWCKIEIPTDTRPVDRPPTTDTEARLHEKAKAAGLSLEELAERDTDCTTEGDPLAAAVQRLTSRSHEQILAAREQLLQTARRGRPIPAGKTFIEVVEGTWPGDETDEQIRSALEKLS